MTLASPLWLLGLALLPVVRWLHRAGRHRRVVAVPHLALWRDAAVSLAAASRRQPPDPAWRRRALLAALLLLALAGPRLEQPTQRITLWIDDSPSMFTREAEGTRIAIGLARARSLLASQARAEVEVRTLADPWHPLGPLADDTASTLAARRLRDPPAPPPPALLAGQRQHWLVTDAAHPELIAWPGSRRPDRVIRVGAVTRNVGIERLAARRAPGERGRIELLAKVANGGSAVENRTLVLIAGDSEVSRTAVRLDPEASTFVSAVIPDSNAVEARLLPGDALAQDDEIALDLAPLRRHRIAIDPACPRTLVLAIATHPALSALPAGTAGADAALDCASVRTATPIPRIQVRTDRLSQPAAEPLRWSSTVPASQRIRLDVDRLRYSAPLSPRPGDDVLLAAGDQPLVVRRVGEPAVIETTLDFGAAEMASDAQVPLLVNWLAECLFDAPLLDAIALVDRGARSSAVVPGPRTPVASTAPSEARARESRDESRILLVLVGLGLAWEIVALARQWWRLSARVDAGSA
jgi:hypothetical protein